MKVILRSNVRLPCFVADDGELPALFASKFEEGSESGEEARMLDPGAIDISLKAGPNLFPPGFAQVGFDPDFRRNGFLGDEVLLAAGEVEGVVVIDNGVVEIKPHVHGLQGKRYSRKLHDGVLHFAIPHFLDEVVYIIECATVRYHLGKVEIPVSDEAQVSWNIAMRQALPAF